MACSTKPKHRIRYTDAQVAFVQNLIVRGYRMSQISAEYNKFFNRNDYSTNHPSPKNIGNLRRNKQIIM